MPKRSEFYLYKRQKKKRSYWYVCFIDRKSGRQGNAKSIDVLKEELGLGYGYSVRNRAEAFKVALMALERKGNDNHILLSGYCQKFWSFDESDYIRMRNSIKKGSIGREYAKNMLLFFNKHVLPFFDREKELSDVTLEDLETLSESLRRGTLSSGTMQLILLSVSVPLKEAYRSGLIDENPAERLMKIEKENGKRGYLTLDECLKVLRYLDSSGNQYFTSYVLALRLAFYSGMRSGEIRALRISAFENTKYPSVMRLNITESIAPYSGVKGTKGKYERAILVPKLLFSLLLSNSNEKGLCLPSKSGGYISSPTLRNFFSRILVACGIDVEEQKRRKLTFHSIRHSFSTIGKEEHISREDRMLALGHRSERVNENYTHVSDESLMGIYPLTLLFVSETFPSVREDELAALPVKI